MSIGEYPMMVSQLETKIRDLTCDKKSWNMTAVIYIAGMHYAVSGVRMCDGRLEIEYNHKPEENR